MDTVRTTPAEAAEAGDRNSIAVVPLAIQLLAGPGSISTATIEMHRPDAGYHGLLVIFSIALACLLLAAIAVEIMANGLKELFPVLAG